MKKKKKPRTFLPALHDICNVFNVHLDCLCLLHLARTYVRMIIMPVRIAVVRALLSSPAPCRRWFETNLNRFLSLWHICKLNNYTHSHMVCVNRLIQNWFFLLRSIVYRETRAHNVVWCAICHAPSQMFKCVKFHQMHWYLNFNE